MTLQLVHAQQLASTGARSSDRRAGPSVAHRRRLAALLSAAVVSTLVLAQEPTATQPSPAFTLPLAQEEVFCAALRRVAPCIVRIDTIGGVPPAPETDSPDGQPAAPLFRQADGPTTGVICAADGYILSSSFNFRREPAVITVLLHDGRRFVGKLVARDIPAGLTVLRIEAVDLPVPRWLPRDELRPGQWALVAGYGQNTVKPAVSIGVISAVDRLEGRAVQTDAKISPANYGGPLFDIAGRMIGVCVPKAGGNEDELAGVEWYDSGIGFAAGADYIARRLPRLIAGQDLHRGVIGVRLDGVERVVGSPQAGPSGVRVTGVAPGPAADAGLQIGDVLTRVNDRPVTRLLEFRRELAQWAAGDTIALTFRRDDQEATVSLRLARLDELQSRAGAETASQPATMPAEPRVPGARP